MKVLLVLTALVAAASAAGIMDPDIEEWDTFKTKHGKIYNNEMEDELRMKIFIENQITIAKHNARYARGEVSYALEANEFSDLLDHELDFMDCFNETAQKTQFQNSMNQRELQSSTFIPSANVVLPSSVDWREKGAVTPVKDQGGCGSCYVFSGTGCLEGQHFLKTGKLVSLSEQNVVDCSSGYGNAGCNGGRTDQAFQYIRGNDGIDTEESYPYKAKDESCRYDPKFKGATVTCIVDLPKGDEEALKNAVATVGPIAVAIAFNPKLFSHYKKGIYYEEKSTGKKAFHAILAVGYGTDNGTDYWLLKNSWGKHWGEEGYFRIARNRDNNCGIASSASYPLV